MTNEMVSWKAAIALSLSAVAEFLGWKGVLMIVWVVVMALDYVSGTFAACRAGEWSSKTARDGLWHKGGMIFVVASSGIADLVMAVICTETNLGIYWPGFVMPLVLVWYIITELGSILENAVKMGAAVPSWLVRLLKAGMEAVDKAADSLDGPEHGEQEQK